METTDRVVEERRSPTLAPTIDVVVVRIYGVGRTQAECTCGWTGNRRLLAAVAPVDALLHAARTGHEPGMPLVVRLF